MSGSMRVEGVASGGTTMPKVDRGSGGRHFSVTQDATLTVRYLRLMNGDVSSDNGGIVNVQQGGTLMLEQAWLSGGRAGRGGGAVYLTGSGARMQARDSTFSGNSAEVSRAAAAAAEVAASRHTHQLALNLRTCLPISVTSAFSPSRWSRSRADDPVPFGYLPLPMSSSPPPPPTLCCRVTD